MPSVFELAIPHVLLHEGGLADNKDDPGGITQFGISLRWLKAQGHDVGDFTHDGDVNPDDIRKMSKDDAINLYRTYWWDKFGFSRFDFQPLATKVFDGAVNMGVKQAVILLQRVFVTEGDLAFVIDGVLGPDTIQTANSLTASNGDKTVQFMLDYVGVEEVFYNKLADSRPKFEQFRKSWINRASEIYMPVG
jgi:lysozyme family protein